MTIDELTTAALQLKLKQRARLAERLLRSLDDLNEDEIQELWVKEALRRKAELDRNPEMAIPGEDVLRALRDRLA